MSQSDALSVVLFTYNHRPYLRAAVQGVLAQSLPPQRVLVRDDCSPNDSEAELRAEISGLDGVELLRCAHNLGPVANFRAGVASVQTPWYMLHAGDDVLVDHDFFRDAVAILQAEPGIVAVFGQLLRVDPDGRPREVALPAPAEAWTRLPGAALRRELAQCNPVPAPCVVLRSAVHERVAPFPIDSRYRHDWQQWVLLSTVGDFARINRVVMHSVVHGANLSVGDAQYRKMYETLEADVAALCARSELNDADRAALRSGMVRELVRGARARELPALLRRFAADPALAPALRESGRERLARRLAKLRRGRV